MLKPKVVFIFKIFPSLKCKWTFCELFLISIYSLPLSLLKRRWRNFNLTTWKQRTIIKVKFLCLSEGFVYILVTNTILLSSLENPRKFSWNQLCQGLGAISISSCVGKDALNIIVDFMSESKVKFSIETAIN